MAKNELSIDFNSDYELVGIISSVKDYQLAFHLNKCFEVDLVRENDHKLEFKRGNSLEFSVFFHEDDSCLLTIFRNTPFEKTRGRNSYLIKERKEFDYFLKIEGHINGFEIEETVDVIKQIKTIQFAQLLELDNIDSKENLIY